MSSNAKDRVRKLVSSQKDEIKVFDRPEDQILAKASMWTGSTRHATHSIPVMRDGVFYNEELTLIPAVVKLIDEILSNSVDEHIRTKDKSLRGWSLDKIDVSLSSSGKLIVKDNGGISTDLHSSGKYPIEVIFGQLFSSSNYDDTQSREVVGTNGVGSVLTNILSKRFNAQSCDGKKKVEVTWSENKSSQTEPIVTKTKEHWTRIEADLDLEYFSIDELHDDYMKKIERFCIIMAASNPGLEVVFNDESFKFNSFKDYISLYGDDEILGEKNDDWEFYLTPSGGNPQRFAIVNGAECNDGSHIKYLETIIGKRINQKLEKLKMSSLITSHMIKQEYTLFINMTIDKPEYSSQSKTELTNEMSKLKDDGTKHWLTMSNKLSAKIKDSFIIKSLIMLFNEKNEALKNKEVQRKAKELNKRSTKSIKKLLDCTEKNMSKRRKNSELWIFEGDSAGKGFRPARDPKTQGCYFLRGKCKNSINMSTIKVLTNEDFANILITIGLDARNPNDVSKLRYSKLVISTDADVDGHSIVGQLLTLFAIHFPELINQGFIHRSVSPLWRAKKGKTVKYFYTTESYNEWSTKNKGYTGKYFKGLGSLEKADYVHMINEPKLERFTLDDNCIEILTAFMGSDPKKRKRLLEEVV